MEIGGKFKMTIIFKAEETIEFIGDSITDCGRMNPETQALGNGYVRLIYDLLQAGYPELKLNIINKGVSGDQVPNLKSRWKPDVIEINPNWLYIYIGINDVWRFFEGNREDAVPLNDFQNIYRQLINGARSKTQAQLRLISPFLAEKEKEDAFRNKLSQYQTAIDTLASEFDLQVIHLQPAFDWAMLTQPASFWTTDRVHPTQEGHMLIALTILRACGYRL
jgi:lysophospholipase L1-like esterase